MDAILNVFHYAFAGEVRTHIQLDPVRLGGDRSICSAGSHRSGCCTRRSIFGYRIGPVAYLTDHSEIPEESFAQLENLEVLFLDALRHKPHPTHSTVERSLKYVERLRPKRALFTHIAHDLSHARTEELLPENVRLAYDGLHSRGASAAP
jgi:phosphoribosyl 1,2-cyclic phosphate phosphodiesterase